MRELRKQIAVSRTTLKTKYTSRRECEPLQFLMSHYGDEIRAGILTRGQLAHLDPGLYVAVRNELRVTRGTDIREFFEEVSTGRTMETPNQRKNAACAAILGTDEKTAARFFGNLRATRVR